MHTFRLFALSLLCSLALISKSNAAVGLSDDLLVCPYSAETTALSSNCEKYTSFYKIDPQNREIWVFGQLDISADLLQGSEPLGLFIYGKAASRAYLNGELLGHNGQPGPDKKSETPGKMDAVIYVPKERLVVGPNTLAIHMSSHHGWWKLASPMHRIELGSYFKPENNYLEKYWPSLLPFGVLIIGALYMGLLAFAKRDHWSVGLLPIMSLIAATQLYAEVYRAFVAYPYPVHDIRLSVILFCSTLFGICLLAHVIWSLSIKAKVRTFLIVSAVTLLCIGLIQGFDLKSAAGLIIPALVSLGLSVYKTLKKEPRARALSIILAIFVLAIIFSPGLFLDVTFFYILAAFLIVLFINEIQTYLAERNAHLMEQARADKLQAILEQKQERDKAGSIKVGSAGKLELINLSDIVYCKGAGDYAELVLTDGRSVLHSERLVELEKTLPSVFLRVHRSYIVNTSMILSLERKPSGVGELSLSGEHVVPVSRRIMPSVREQLT